MLLTAAVLGPDVSFWTMMLALTLFGLGTGFTTSQLINAEPVTMFGRDCHRSSSQDRLPGDRKSCLRFIRPRPVSPVPPEKERGEWTTPGSPS
jgi:hypothetical protein